MEEKDVLAPVRFAASPIFLSGLRPEALPASVIWEVDLVRAMDLENSQEPPKGFLVWNDRIEDAVAPFYSTAEARDAKEKIEPVAAEVWQQLEPKERLLRKKQMRGGLSKKEEFWLTVAYDSFEKLQLVATARFVTRGRGEPFLERLYDVFCAGFYPCGVDDTDRIVVFDLRTLADDQG